MYLLTDPYTPPPPSAGEIWAVWSVVFQVYLNHFDASCVFVAEGTWECWRLYSKLVFSKPPASLTNPRAGPGRPHKPPVSKVIPTPGLIEIADSLQSSRLIGTILYVLYVLCIAVCLSSSSLSTKVDPITQSHLSVMSDLECGFSGTENNKGIHALALIGSAPVKCRPNNIVSALVMTSLLCINIDLFCKGVLPTRLDLPHRSGIAYPIDHFPACPNCITSSWC